MSEWKNVYDQLPPKNKLVLVVDYEDLYAIDYFDPKSGWDRSTDAQAWMELQLYIKKKD